MIIKTCRIRMRSIFCIFGVVLWITPCLGDTQSATTTVNEKFKQAFSFYARGDYPAAIELLDEVLTVRIDAATYYLKGYAFYQLGHKLSAWEAFNEAYLIDSNFLPHGLKAGLAGGGTNH